MDEPASESLANREGYLYAILNLSKHASQAEINEKYRSLSLVFHPDKQTDEELKATASKEFLEIQKAYQVLSDPFLRQVYDILGSEGLKIKWPSHLRARTEEEIKDMLQQNKIHIERQRLRRSLLPKGQLTWQLDASSIFNTQNFWSGSWITKLTQRSWAPRTLGRNMVYGAEKKLTEKTTISFQAHSSVDRRRASTRFLGTIRHQFSPRVTTSTSLNIFYPFNTNLEIKYDDSDNVLNVETAFQPLSPLALPPTFISFSRRLYRSGPQRGKITLKIDQAPSISFNYISPPSLREANEGEDQDLSPQRGPPTTSGLKYVLFDRNIGFTFDPIPQLMGEIGMNLIELSTRIHAGIRWGFSGFILSLGANWSNKTTEIASTLILNNTGIVAQIECGYLDQRLSLPIVLSTHYSPYIAFGAAVIPSTASLLVYHFIVKPRRRARRQAYLRAIKKDFEQDSDARKERNAVEGLLKDFVKRQVRHETEREGLIIQDATYGAAEKEDMSDNVVLDVRIPLQALVRNSQLHIAGGDTKAALQGFSDPAPFTPKILCIRYLFRGRVHYAEIPDYLPVVLPLAEHQVN